MLQKTATEAALRAADDLSTVYHQFVTRGRHETRRVHFEIGVDRLSCIAGEYGIQAQSPEPLAQRFRDPFVIAVNRVAKIRRIIRYDCIGQFVVVENRTSA